jgi:hypothetical protein
MMRCLQFHGIDELGYAAISGQPAIDVVSAAPLLFTEAFAVMTNDFA